MFNIFFPTKGKKRPLCDFEDAEEERKEEERVLVENNNRARRKRRRRSLRRLRRDANTNNTVPRKAL